MQLKTGLLFGLWLLGLTAGLLRTHDLYLPTDDEPSEYSSERSMIVQGENLDTIASAVENAGGLITHRLKIINAVGARLTPTQVAALDELHGTVRIYANADASIASDSDDSDDSDGGDSDDSDGGESAGEDNAAATVPYSQFPSLVGVDQLQYQGLTGKGVTVAVLDTGLWFSDTLTHDTNGNSRVLARYDAINDQLHEGNDDNGHGTHVASVILSSASPTARPGIYNGIAPDASLIAVKAFDIFGNGTYLDIIRGIEWIIDHRDVHNIRVLNLSFSAAPRSYYWDDPLNQAVMAAWKAGIVVITSAGNTGPEAMTIGVPGNAPYVITVGSMTDAFTPRDRSDDHLSFYSAAGPTVEGFVKPDLIAPGGHILGILDALSFIASQHPEWFDGAYFTMSGTSQAAAVVSGVAALLLQADPWLQPDELKCRLLDSARPAVDSNNRLAYSPFQQGAGLVHAADAVHSTMYGCANRGLNIGLDLDDSLHYQGPARWQQDRGFYLADIGYVWDGNYRSGNGLSWIVANPWLDATPWVDSNPWLDATPWVDSNPWLDATPWISATPWIDHQYNWSNGLSETMATNLWVDQD